MRLHQKTEELSHTKEVKGTLLHTTLENFIHITFVKWIFDNINSIRYTMFNSRFHQFFPNEMNLNKHLFGKIWMWKPCCRSGICPSWPLSLSHLRKNPANINYACFVVLLLESKSWKWFSEEEGEQREDEFAVRTLDLSNAVIDFAVSKAWKTKFWWVSCLPLCLCEGLKHCYQFMLKIICCNTCVSACYI